MKEITLIVPNKVGMLAGVTEELGKNGVNLTAISAQSFGNTGVIRLITLDPKSAVRVLSRFMGGIKTSPCELRLGDVIIVKVPDRAGELAKVVRKIARSGINIESVYSLGTVKGKAEIAIKPESMEKAVAALKKEGIRVRI